MQWTPNKVTALRVVVRNDMSRDKVDIFMAQFIEACQYLEGKGMPPTEPAMPPSPTTVATSFLGNMSETVVNRLADQAWWAEAARPMMRTADQSPTLVTNRIGSTSSAKRNMPVLRARVIVQPRPFR